MRLDELSEAVLKDTGNTENKDKTESSKTDTITEGSEDEDISDTSGKIDEINEETEESRTRPESDTTLGVIMHVSSEFVLERVVLFVRSDDNHTRKTGRDKAVQGAS